MTAREHGIPVFQELYRAVECLRTVMHRQKQPLAVIAAEEAGKPSPLSPDMKRLLDNASGPLDEFISKKILKTYDILTVDEAIADDVHECLQAAAQIGYPVVMKGLQEGGVHKTELGLVYLDIRNKSTAARTFKTLTRKMGGLGRVLIQKHVKGHVELILGLIRDPQFGPCVMIGLGGVMAEVFQDAVFAMAPLNHQEALALTGRLQGQQLLDGFRGNPPVNREEIARMLVALGTIGLAYPRIQEIDINPLIVDAAGAVAVDATIILR
jgi:acetyltransferase